MKAKKISKVVESDKIVFTKDDKVVMTKAQYDAFVVATSSKTKEFSEFFCDSERNALKFRNLSETKKYFEVEQRAKVQAFVVANDNKLLTSKEFHKLVSY